MELRSFMFSFLGEIAKHCPESIATVLGEIVPYLISNIVLFPDSLDPNG